MDPYAVFAFVAALGTLVACNGKAANTLAEDDAGGATSEEGGGAQADASMSSTSGGGGGGASGGAAGQFSSSKNAGMGNGSCQTGTYTGTFSCGFVFDKDASANGSGGAPSDGGGFMITGNLSFLLTQSLSGELGQDTASGMFVLNAGLTTGMATLSGTLDCSSGQFTGALSGGMYSLLGIFTGAFDGPLTSEYNGMESSFVNGVWSLSVPGQGYCPGSWTANFTGDQ